MKLVRERGFLYELKRGGNERDESRGNFSWNESKGNRGKKDFPFHLQNIFTYELIGPAI